MQNRLERAEKMEKNKKNIEPAQLTEEAKKARNAYAKKWRENNRDKVRASMARYWIRKAEQLKAAEGGTK